MSPVPTDAPRILVVDHDEATRHLTCRHLRGGGFRVIEAATAAQGLELAQQVPEGIVLALHLPDLPDFEVCQRLRADPVTAVIPVLHLTASSPDDDTPVAEQDGDADAFLTLPVPPAELLTHVRALVRSGRLLRDVQEREKRFRALFEASGDGLALVDPDSLVLVMVNSSFTRIVSHTQQELLGHAVLEFLPPERHEYAMATFQEARARGHVVAPDLVKRRPDGALAHLSLSITLLEMDGQTYFLCSMRDETEYRDLQQRLTQSSRMASMGLLAAGVAHELNNPLAWVLYNLQAVAEELDQQARDLDPSQRARLAPLRSHLQAAEDGAQRMRGIVSDLQTFSRADQETHSACDLVAVVQAAVSMARNEIRFRARLELELPPELPVVGNDGRLSQVFLNLLVNAARSIEEGHPERHVVSVRGAREEGQVRVTVSDTGRGIPQALLGHIFDPFTTARTQREGVGLGLAICHTIVREHGGHIDAASAPGRGSTFTVVLPEHRPAPPAPDPTPPADEPDEPDESLRLLLVDDEPHLLRALCRLLERAGHAVVTAASGLDAERILAEDTSFDVVVCDLMLPDKLGIDLHAAIRERDPELAQRFLFLTGGTFTPRAQEYLTTIANPVLGKPTPRARLLEAVATLAARHRGQAG